MQQLSNSTNNIQHETPWITTFKGKEVELLNPTVEDIDPEDIAHSSALIYRFTGHSTEGYSVGQHQIVGSIMAELLYSYDKELPAQYLLHDSPESYIGDVSSPLKSLLPGYREIEDRFVGIIEQRFLVNLRNPLIKEVDLRMLATEIEVYIPDGNKHWNKLGYPKFTLEEVAATVDNRSEEDLLEFWNNLWTPWEPQVTEELYLDRMRALGIK